MAASWQADGGGDAGRQGIQRGKSIMRISVVDGGTDGSKWDSALCVCYELRVHQKIFSKMA